MKKLYLLLIALLFVPTIALAEECSDTDLVKLKEKASKTEFKLVPMQVLKTGLNSETGEEYEYTKNIFKLVVSNLDDDLYYQMYVDDSDYVSWDSRRTPNLNGQYQSIIDNDYEKIRIQHLDIFAKDKCDNKLVLSLQVTVPMKNGFSSMQVCDGISNYYLCEEYLYTEYDISFDEVEKSTNKFRNGQVDEKGKEKKKGLIESITDFVNKFIAPLVILLVLASGVIVFFTIKRRNRMKKHFN